MTSLWIGIFLLAALTALFLIWPLLRREKLTKDLVAQQHARQLANITLYRQKTAQLELDLEEGRVEEAAFPQMKAEIEDLLLDDAKVGQQKEWQQPSSFLKKTALVVVIGAVLGTSLLLYERIGGRLGLESWYAQQQLIEEGRTDFGSLLRRLEDTVQANPDDTQGWSLLARVYLDLGDLEKGANAIGEIIRIEGASAMLLAQQAQALYFVDGQRLSGRVESLIDQALKIDAKDPATLSLLGMAAYHQQDWEAARGYWEAALPRASGIDADESLREGIADVRERLGMAPLSASGPQFSVTISLSNAASLLVDQRATVFVFAQPVGGAGAPLAATRIKVSDLPTTIMLSDQQAMMPQNNLSSVKQVVIQARVAIGGTPQAQEGDWQGQTQVLEVGGQQRVELEINRQL